MRILHVGASSAFVDFLVGYFERAAPGANSVVRLPRSGSGAGLLGTAHAAAGYGRHLVEVVCRARSADVVVAHMMTLPSALAIVAAPSRAFTVWSGWGVDYYGRGAHGGPDRLLGPQTARLAQELQLDRGPRGGRPVRLLTERLISQAVKRVDAFSAPIPDDLAFMRLSYPQFGGSYHQLNYADIASFAGQSTASPGRDILLGNSAWTANNHLEAIERLSALDLSGRKVFTPLTYGDPRYREVVMERGRRLLGDAFDPLVQPLPFEEYLERVSRCGIVVMNHYRQQGLGNVGIGLYSGAHVYLSRANPLHTFLVRAGLDVEDLESTEALPEAPVTAEALDRRRALMARIWGEDVVLDNVRRVLDAASPGLDQRQRSH